MKIDFLLTRAPQVQQGVFGWKKGENCQSIRRVFRFGHLCFRVVDNFGVHIYEFEPVHVATRTTRNPAPGVKTEVEAVQ